MKTKIQVILGSTREKRFGPEPANWILSELQKNPEIEAELIDLRDYPLPFFNEAMSAAMNQGNWTTPGAKAWADKVAEADGYIIVSPEYNHGYPAVLKNALDYVYYQWNDKPVGFVSYGTVGGARAVEQLRQVVVELHMVPVRTSVNINAYWNLLDEAGHLKTESFQKTADDMIAQVLWYAKTLAPARAAKSTAKTS